jgi:hypothetical protein
MTRRPDDEEWSDFASDSELVAQYHAHSVRAMTDAGESLDVEEVLARLDPIPEALVGGARIDRLFDMAPPFAREALRLILADGSVHLEQRRLPEWADDAAQAERREKRGAPTIGEHLDAASSAVVLELAKIGLYERVHPREIEAAKQHAFASLFTIVKAGSAVPPPSRFVGLELLRPVIDGRRGNEKCAERPVFGFATLDALQQAASNMSAEATTMDSRAAAAAFPAGKRPQPLPRSYYVLNLDARHCYYQYSAPRSIGMLNLLRVFNPERHGVEVYRPTTVVMGFSLAPWIAQSALMTFMLGGGRPPGVQPEVLQSTVLPPWVPLRDGSGHCIGAAFGLLDNLLVMTTSYDLMLRWKARIESQRDFLNLTLKTAVDIVAVHEAADEKHSFFDYNGIAFGFSSWSTSGKGDGTDEAFRSRWKWPTLDPTGAWAVASPGLLTHRHVSAALGRVVWDLRVRRQTFLQTANEELLAVYQFAQPRAAADAAPGGARPSGKEYDKPAALTAKLAALLFAAELRAREHVRCACVGPWHPGRSVAYASDASLVLDAAGNIVSGGLATVRLGSLQELTAAGPRPRLVVYAAAHQLQPIAIAEMQAVLICAIQAKRVDPALSMLVLCCDSLVVKGSLERGFSTNPLMRAQLLQLREICGDTLRLCCLYVKSEDNCSDFATRTSTRARGMTVAERAATTALAIAGLRCAGAMAVEQGRAVVRSAAPELRTEAERDERRRQRPTDGPGLPREI